ncbi:hypothetical protein Hypma_005388 [Hypsizygus marmoreus]|uniref:Uncharacterized protein n=1 Tax=Hypsizygus marmoreus TaxID=39966 RepID=A0A369JWV4_HYPMA|nr:hypothetical protein Hypma_005388 [Hypsizygus marmoreus]
MLLKSWRKGSRKCTLLGFAQRHIYFGTDAVAPHATLGSPQLSGSQARAPVVASPRRDRDKDWWEPPPSPSRKRFSQPAWERPKESRDRPPPPSRVQERKEEKSRVPIIQPVISWFVKELPAPGAFDVRFSARRMLWIHSEMRLFSAVVAGAESSEYPPLPLPEVVVLPQIIDHTKN